MRSLSKVFYFCSVISLIGGIVYLVYKTAEYGYNTNSNILKIICVILSLNYIMGLYALTREICKRRIIKID
jgi:hypothetical protein